jgi:hypothetical protein
MLHVTPRENQSIITEGFLVPICDAEIFSYPNRLRLQGKRIATADDLNTVCHWISNSPEVAARHYAVSVDLDSDFKRAAGLLDKAQQTAVETDGQPGTAQKKQIEQTPVYAGAGNDSQSSSATG